jgi:hypothetical protein
VDKKQKKRIDKKCTFCEVDDYNLLDVHRIIPGSKYTKWGTATTCANCHRKCHSGEIKILGKYKSIVGNVINYMENNEEKWVRVS